MENAVRENVDVGVERLRGLEPLRWAPDQRWQVKVFGGVYNLSTGAVTMIGKEA